MSSTGIQDFLDGLEKRAKSPENPGEWDHERFLDYRRRISACLDAHLARFVGVPTVMPPELERPEFLPETPDVDYGAKIRRRLQDIRESDEPALDI